MPFSGKIGSSLLVLLGVIILVFLMFQGFGDPARMLAGQSGNDQTISNIRKDLNLDKPIWKQLILYLNDVSPVGIHSKEEIARNNLKGFFLPGDRSIGVKVPYLGRSYQSRRPVTEVLIEALPGTLVLAFSAMLIACIAGIGLGVLAALKKGTWMDSGIIISSIAGISAPSFFMAILIAYIFGIVLHDQTGLNFTGSLFTINALTGKSELELRNLILPAITLGIRPLAIIAQLTRSSMIDVLSQDFIRTAYAKGLSRRRVILRHALPNAMNPVVTAISGWFAELLAGSFFIEYIFGWKGIGKLTVDALEKLDYPLVMGAVLLSACIFIFINLLTELIYRYFDPRIS